MGYTATAAQLLGFKCVEQMRWFQSWNISDRTVRPFIGERQPSLTREEIAKALPECICKHERIELNVRETIKPRRTDLPAINTNSRVPSCFIFCLHLVLILSSCHTQSYVSCYFSSANMSWCRPSEVLLTSVSSSFLPERSILHCLTSQSSSPCLL